MKFVGSYYYYKSKDYSDGSQKLDGHFTQVENITCGMVRTVSLFSVQSVVGDSEQWERSVSRTTDGRDELSSAAEMTAGMRRP